MTNYNEEYYYESDDGNLFDDPGHPLKTINPKKKYFNELEATDQCKQYLTEFLAIQNCDCLRGMNRRETKCSCLTFMKQAGDSEEVDAIVRYMIHWARFSGQTKNQVFLE